MSSFYHHSLQMSIKTLSKFKKLEVIIHSSSFAPYVLKSVNRWAVSEITHYSLYSALHSDYANL